MAEKKLDKLKLMVVDDEPDNLELLYRTFWRDFKVYKANNARDALSVLDKEGEMAVIISDQRMPDMNGTELLSRTVERFPDTIRILLTGFTDVEDLVDAINSGQVFKYITKPWNPDRLKALIEQASDTYRMVKKRTEDLRRALRREALFNAVTTSIRESLDYNSMLQKIVATLGETFAATHALLIPVEGDSLMSTRFSYHEAEATIEDYDPDPLIALVLQTGNYQLVQNTGDPVSYLALPLTYQQHLLAIIALYQRNSENPWKNEDILLMTGVAEQVALALSQAKFYQRLQEKQQQIRAELEVARQIQHNLLRQTLPVLEGARVQACCYPAQEVGGDFFEVFVHPRGDLWLAVGDVSGKGVPAALFMASAISLLSRELSQESPADPNVIMHNLNHSLSDDLISNNCFITLAIACYTPSSRELTYANAGHVYPMHWSRQVPLSDEPNYLKTRSIPLGILPNWQAQSGRLTLAPGDTLLLNSDGLTEAKMSGKMIGSDGLWQLIQHQAQPLILQDLLNLIQEVNEIQEDDQTILSLEVL